MYIAVPITARTLTQAINDTQEAIERGADIVEFRIDFLRDLNPAVLEELLASCPIPKIVTNRHKSEASDTSCAGFTGSEEERIFYLRRAIVLGAEYIDIEAGYVQQMNRRKTKLIVSYVNFHGTPQNLERLYESILVSNNADVVKIAAKADTNDDVHRMVRMIEHTHTPIIGICTGKLGRTTRLHPGNYLTYACLDHARASAPGQYTIEEVKDLLQR